MKKVDYKHGTFVLATTETDGLEDYGEYLSWCEGNNKEPAPERSDAHLAWIYEEAMLNLADDMSNIKDCEAYNVPVVLNGTVKRWDGEHEILPETFGSVYDAIKRCQGRDIQDITVCYDDGKITVDARHHDGTDSLEIRALSKKGQNKNDTVNGIEKVKDAYVKRLPYLYAIKQ